MSNLPERPSLDQLKLRVRELQGLHGERRQAAAARIAAHHPDSAGQSVRAVLDAPFKLADAQLVIASEHGLESWAAMKHIVHVRHRVTLCRSPGEACYGGAVSGAHRRTCGIRRALGEQPSLRVTRLRNATTLPA